MVLINTVRSALRRRESPSAAADIAVAALVGGASYLARMSGNALLMFPELGALTYGVLHRPNGAWASSPVLLVVTPFLAGAVGTVVTRSLPYGVLSVLIVVFSALLIIRLLRSPIAPAISAGLLPLTLGETGWWYAPSLVVGCGTLAVISVLRRRFWPPAMETEAAGPDEGRGGGAPGRDLSWLPFFAAFLVVAAACAILTGMRFLLFPPLVVIAYEMFVHVEKCPWARRPLLVPVICGFTALVAMLVLGWLGAGAMAAALSALCATIVLRISRLYFPPAVAVAVLPFVMSQPDFRYPVAVTMGAAILCVAFYLWRRLVGRTI